MSSPHHRSIQTVISDLYDLHGSLCDQFAMADAHDMWESDEQRREADDEIARVVSAFRVLGGQASMLLDRRDTIARRYADV